MARIDFRWIRDGRLAGASKPGLFDDLEDDLAFLSGRGVRLVVTLTETALDAGRAPEGVDFLHFPIEDMGVPTPRDTFALCVRILLSIEKDRPVAVHCKAGLGRTGTILACCLVTDGVEPEHAIRQIRLVNPNYIQTQSQERFVRHYRDHLRREGFLEGDDTSQKGPELPPLRLSLRSPR